MKSIIRGKRYDTEHAELVADASSGTVGDFSHYREGLYRTPRGTWFLAGSGGAMTRYSESAEGGRMRQGGERVIPLTPEQALDWLERQGEVEAVETWFAAEVEDA